MKRFGWVMATLVTISFLFFSSPAFGEILVVVNPKNSTSELSMGDLRKMYLKKKKKFSNGLKVQVLDQKDEQLKGEFSKKALRKSINQIKAYWAKRIFTGKGTPPAALANSDSVKKWVNNNEEGIGYIRRGEEDSSVKVVLAIP